MSEFTHLIGSEYPKKVIPLIDDARKSIEIVVYDWRWYKNRPGDITQQFNLALVRAAKRGIQVRALCNRDAIIPDLQDVGIKARSLSDRRTLHTKLMIIDDDILIIGSHNFTRNAFERNIEVSVIVDIPDGVDRFANFFRRLYEN